MDNNAPGQHHIHMKFSPKYILPTIYELIALVFADLLIVLFSQSRQLLNYYGLSGGDQLLHERTGQIIENGLSRLDSFSATGPVVTFGIWALIGLLCFSVVQGAVIAYQTIEYDKELSSDTYIHPRTFRRATFWAHVLFDIAEAAACVGLLACALGALIGLFIPVALAYSRTFLFDVSLPTLGNFLIGLAVLYVGLVLVDLCTRLLAQRHRIFGRRD